MLWTVGLAPLLLLCVFMSLLFLACARTARRCSEAERRALRLLRDWLSPSQRAQYDREGHFDVAGSDSRKRYRIRPERQLNVDEFDERGMRVAVWCFGPERTLPIGDVMLAQKIALENDEPAALAVANRNGAV
jgi:hypothetical protein